MMQQVVWIRNISDNDAYLVGKLACNTTLLVRKLEWEAGTLPVGFG